MIEKHKQSATDWHKVDALTDDDIHQAVAGDVDSKILSQADFDNMRPAKQVLPQLFKRRQETKVVTTLKISPDVLAYFKAQGDSWQNKIDTILKNYIAHH